MQRLDNLFLTVGLVFFLTSCSQSSDLEYDSSEDSYLSEEESDGDSEVDEVFEDGTYSASVDYYNPETGYTSTYSLDIEVVDNEVTTIYFPNDGYLDDDHIWPSELDASGYVVIDGEDGKTYAVQILKFIFIGLRS